MTKLPKGWAQTSLSTACQLITDGTHHSPANAPSGDFKYITAKHIKKWGMDLKNMTFVDKFTHSQIYNRCPVIKGDVLYIKDGATTGVAALNPLDEQFSMLSSVALIRPDPRLLSNSFLKHKLNSPDMYNQMTGDMTGSAIKRLTLQTISKQTITVPPVPEQQRIVAKIDSLSAKSARARDHLDHIPRLVEKYKQAVLAAAFRGELTGDLQGFNRNPISDLAELVTKGASPKWQGFEYTNDGILFLRSQNVGWGDLRLEERAYLPIDFAARQPRSTIHENDVLLNIVGASIGRSAVATASVEGANCNQAVALIRLKSESNSPKFLCYWLLSKESQSAIAAGTVDFARANFSLDEIKNLNVPWPPPVKRLEIVRRIETAFAWIDRLAAEATSARKLVDRLDAAVLAKAFRGELVPQDPNDEPASVLLERIRAERAAAPAKRRGRKKT